MKPILILLAAAASLTASAAPGQDPSGQQQRQVRQVIVYGADPCPPSSADEVVVCARRPETERYRIPDAQRDQEPGPENESWSDRARDLDATSRAAVGGPGTCEPIGPGHHTGCLQEQLDAARAEREAAEAEGPER